MKKMDRYFKQTSSLVTGITFVTIGIVLFVFNHSFYFKN